MKSTFARQFDASNVHQTWLIGPRIQGGKGTETIKFMALEEIPNILQHRTVTYSRIVVDYCLDPNHVRISVDATPLLCIMLVI